MILWEIVVFLVLLMLSAAFSAIETALTSQTKLNIKQLVESKRVDGNKFKSWLENPSRLLTTILVGNNIVNTIVSVLTTLMAIAISQYYGFSRELTITVAVACVSMILIIFGEIIPKIFAKQNNVSMVLLLIEPLEWMARLLHPFVKVLLWFTNLVIRLFGGPKAKEVPFITTEEIRSLINVGEQEGALKEEQKQMIHSIFEFGNLKVKEVMVPRTEMICLDISLPQSQLIDLIIESGYSRLPVYKGSADNILGLIYTKDLLSLWKHSDLIVIQDLIRPPFFVTESKQVNDLLKEFQRGRIQMAIVLDEYGGTSGLISLEDLIEEIVGEIRDEYDIEEQQIQRLEDGSIIVDARMNITDANHELSIQLPIAEDSNTLGGFITSFVGGVPREGQKIQYENILMVVLKANRRRVEIVKIFKERPSPDSPGQPPKAEGKRMQVEENLALEKVVKSRKQGKNHFDKTRK